MRKLTVLTLVFSLFFLGAPAVGLAQSAQLGSVSGEALDAGARPLVNVTVELVRSIQGLPVGGVVQTTMTDSSGMWMFTNVPAGDYIVRLSVNGQVAGIPVTVEAGVALTAQIIVTPSVATAEPAGLAVPAIVAIFAAGAAAITAILVLTDGS